MNTRGVSRRQLLTSAGLAADCGGCGENGRTAQCELARSLRVRQTSPEVKSCLSCHGKDLHDTVGQMRCSTCHQQLSKKHPTVPGLTPKSNGNLGKTEP